MAASCYGFVLLLSCVFITFGEGHIASGDSLDLSHGV